MNINFVFFGTPRFATIVLDELEAAGFLPSLIVTAPDKPRGRSGVVGAPEAKVWGESRGISILQPTHLDTTFDFRLSTFGVKWDLFVIASYGKIIPKEILDIPKLGALNIHPSLLPRLRGASPIIGTILSESETGVTIMRIDEEMDHGPIVAQRKIGPPANEWPPYAKDLEELLAHEGGKLMAEILPDWVAGKISEHEQSHSAATYTKKVSKEDTFIDLSADPETNLRKIRAYSEGENARTVLEHNGKKFTLIIKQARLESGALVLERVVPEGRKEMSWADFERGFLK